MWGGKGPKIAQNDKTLCLSHSICQEPYIIWSPFVVHNWKIIISPEFFFIFSKFCFFLVVGRVKGQKMVHNDKKTLSFALYISGTIGHLWCICVKG